MIDLCLVFTAEKETLVICAVTVVTVLTVKTDL